MQEATVVALLKSTSADIVVSASVACLIGLLINKSHKFSAKVFFFISFTLGVLSFILLSLITEKTITPSALKSCVVAGSLAVTITAFVKKSAFLSTEDIKSSLEKLLSSIILSDNLDEVVEEIIQKIKKTDAPITKQELESLLKENTITADEDKLETVCRVIMEALDGDNKTDN